MVQIDRPVNIGASADFELTGESSIALSGATPVTVLDIEYRKLKSVTIQIRIDDAVIDGNYTIYGTTKRNPSIVITDDEWSIIQVSTALTHNVTAITTLTGNYTHIIVQATSASGTPIAKAWFKGKN